MNCYYAAMPSLLFFFVRVVSVILGANIYIIWILNEFFSGFGAAFLSLPPMLDYFEAIYLYTLVVYLSSALPIPRRLSPPRVGRLCMRAVNDLSPAPPRCKCQ